MLDSFSMNANEMLNCALCNPVGLDYLAASIFRRFELKCAVTFLMFIIMKYVQISDKNAVKVIMFNIILFG